MTQPPQVFAPAMLGPVRLRNRVVKAAAFEGVTPDALVTDDLVEYLLKVARGGVGMTTVAYLAVSPEGRKNRHQIYLRPDAVPGLRRLTDAVHAEGAAVAAQLGHAGPVANGRSNGAQALSAYRMPSPLSLQMVRTATETDIGRVTSDYADGARLAVSSGSDCLELHLGHNYLLSSFLSPNLNRRRDRWGGTLENRARFARQVVRAVREAVGDDVAVIAKLNMVDGVRSGLGIEESLDVASLLESDPGPRRDRADLGQLADEPDAPVPRGRAAARVRGRDAAAAALGHQGGGEEVLPPLPLRGGVQAADGAAIPRPSGDAADPAGRHHPARDARPRDGGGLRVRRDGPCAAAGAGPAVAHARGDGRRGAVHPLQPLHAHDLLAHPLPGRRGARLSPVQTS